MQAEVLVPVEQRYLSLSAQLTEQYFIREKDAAIAWCLENTQRLDASNLAALDTLQSLRPGPKLIALWVVSCFADIPKDRSYTAAFRVQKEYDVEETCAILRLGIFWHRLPIEGLEHGHHQIAILEFPDGVPTVLRNLPRFDGVQPTAFPTFGMCDMENWSKIRAKIQNA